MAMTRYLTQREVNIKLPGLLDELEVRGVEISNNAGALIVDGYLGDIIDALAVVTGNEEE